MTGPVSARLLAIVEPQWVAQAITEFKLGKTKIYFGTDKAIFNTACSATIGDVLFKSTGHTEVTARAVFSDVTKATPKIEERLHGQAEVYYKVYYGFRGLTLLSSPIPLSSLRHYRSGKLVRNDVPGCSVVRS